MRFLIFACFAGFVSVLSARPLTVSYIEKPPFYYTEGNEAKGFLLVLAQKIFDTAGIAIHFTSRPAKRALFEIESNTNPACSIGWFKNSEREAYAKFTEPIHQDRPMAVLTTKRKEATFHKFASLRDVIASSKLRMGTVTGFSYGTYIDSLLQGAGAHIDRAATTPVFNIKKLTLGRIDYTVVDVQELEFLSKQADVARNKLAVLNFSDIPAGNQRYLMCSKKVDDDTINRINTAIKQISLE